MIKVLAYLTLLLASLINVLALARPSDSIFTFLLSGNLIICLLRTIVAFYVVSVSLHERFNSLYSRVGIGILALGIGLVSLIGIGTSSLDSPVAELTKPLDWLISLEMSIVLGLSSLSHKHRKTTSISPALLLKKLPKLDSKRIHSLPR